MKVNFRLNLSTNNNFDLQLLIHVVDEVGNGAEGHQPAAEQLGPMPD